MPRAMCRINVVLPLQTRQWQPHLCEDKTRWDDVHLLYQRNKRIPQNDWTHSQQFWFRIICKWKVPSQNSSLTCQNYKGDDSLVDLFNLFSLYGSGLFFVFPGSGWIWLLQMWCGIPQTQAGQSRHGVVSFLHGSREHVYLHIICHVSSQLPSCK